VDLSRTKPVLVDLHEVRMLVTVVRGRPTGQEREKRRYCRDAEEAGRPWSAVHGAQ
jgi:hypothetical protein